MRRKCESALTRYTTKAHNKRKIVNKLKPNGVIDKHRDSPADVAFKIPIVHQYGRSVANVKEEKPLELGYVPVTMVIVEHAHNNNNTIEQMKIDEVKCEEDCGSRFKWPGIQEAMESYQRYSKGVILFCFFF